MWQFGTILAFYLFTPEKVMVSISRYSLFLQSVEEFSSSASKLQSCTSSDSIGCDVYKTLQLTEEETLGEVKITYFTNDQLSSFAH